MSLYLVLLFVLGVVIGACADSFFGMWLGIEIASLAVYPFIVSSDNSEHAYSSLFNYFVVQVVSSCLLYLGMVILWGFWTLQVGSVITLSALCIKFGSVFVGWLSSVIESMSWLGVLLVLGVQKVPLLVVMMCVLWEINISSNSVVVLGVIVGTFSVMSYSWLSVRGFMVFSSVLNSSWIWCGLVFSQVIGVVYFGMYVMCLLAVCVMFSSLNRVEYQSSLCSGQQLGVLEAGVLLLLSGVPPSVVFFCNVEVISCIVLEDYLIECWFLMILSVFLVYMYVNLALSNLFLGMIYSSSNSSCLVFSGISVISALWGIMFMII